MGTYFVGLLGPDKKLLRHEVNSLKVYGPYLHIGQYETLILKTVQKVSDVTFKKDLRTYFIS